MIMFVSRFPSRESEFDRSVEAEECSRQVMNVSNIPDDKFISTELGRYFTAYLFPFCNDKERYLVINKIMLLNFVMDDHTDNKWGEVARNSDKFRSVWGQLKYAFEKILDPSKNLDTTGWKPFTVMMYNLFDEVSKTYNNVQKKRLVSVWLDQIDGTLKRTQMIETKSSCSFDEMEDYYKFRVESIRLKPLIQLQEYGDNMFISDHVWSNKEFQDYLNLASYCIFLCSDLFSFRSEQDLFHGQLEKIDNTVVVMAKLNHISIDEALEQTCRLCVHYEDLLHKKRKCFANEFGQGHSVVIWIANRIEYMVGGNYHATLKLLHGRLNAI